jgi:hypothetical protein
LSDTFTLNYILTVTDFFNENAEGLNLDWLADDRKMANPDALIYNEYQETNRITNALQGKFELTPHQQLSCSLYYRGSDYEESVPSSVQHRSMRIPVFLCSILLLWKLD